MAETFDINENVTISLFWLHVKKRTKKYFFVLARRHRTQPPSQAGVGFGLGSGSPVWFWRSFRRRGIKLRQHQGPTGGGVRRRSSGRCGRAARGPRSALPPYFSASGLLSKPPHGGPGGEPSPLWHACHSLPSSTSNHSAGLSACLISETCRRAELNGWGRGLFVHVCRLFMDQWMSFGDRERSDRALLAEPWRVFPPQPNELALPAVHLRSSPCQSRSSSEIHSHAVISVVI